MQSSRFAAEDQALCKPDGHQLPVTSTCWLTANGNFSQTKEFASGQASVINAGTAVCSWRARIPEGRTINPATAPNLAGNRLDTQQEWEHKENAVSSAVWLGGKSQRCDNFSSVMQGFAAEARTEPPFMLYSA